VTVNADDFTAFLADRLAAIVPAGFHVEARDGMLWYSADQGRFPGQQGDHRVGQAGTYVRDNLRAYGETDADDLTRVAAGRTRPDPTGPRRGRAQWEGRPRSGSSGGVRPLRRNRETRMSSA
jgi:hypothetical protein